MSETKWQKARPDEFPMVPDDELAPDDPLEPHPLSKMFPPMPETELAALAEDITRHGLHDPIVLFEGKILDGRHRYRACRSTGVPLRTRNYEGADPAGFVWSANFHRRQLNNEGKRKAIAAYDKLNPGLSANEVSKRLNVSHHTVISVREEVTSNWQIANKPEDAAPPPPERREASGRKARGRKPASTPRAAPPAKPNGPALQRDRSVVSFADMLRRNFEQGLDDITRAIAGHGERIAQISEEKRKALISRYAEALGMASPYAEPLAAEGASEILLERVDELERQLRSREPDDAGEGPKPGRRGKYPFGKTAVGESFIDSDTPTKNLASAAWMYGRRHGMEFTVKQVDGGSQVTRIK